MCSLFGVLFVFPFRDLSFCFVFWVFDFACMLFFKGFARLFPGFERLFCITSMKVTKMALMSDTFVCMRQGGNNDNIVKEGVKKKLRRENNKIVQEGIKKN